MNASPEKELRNPWEDRADFPRIEKRNLAFSLLIVLLCSLTLPLALFYESVSLLILAALFVYVVAMVRVPSSVTLLLLTVFASVSLTQSLAIGAMILALIIGTGATAFLFTAMERSYVLLLLPTAACVASYAVLGDWRLSLLAFAFLPAAVLLAVATRLGRSRTSAVCFAEGGFLLVILGVGGYLLYQYCQEAGISIAEYVDRLRESEKVFSFASEFMERMFAPFQTLGAEQDPEVMETLLSEENIRMLIDTFFNILPALFLVACSIIAFEAQLLLNACYRTVGWKQVLTPAACVFTMSPFAAVIYFVSFVASLLVSLFGWDYTLAVAVIDNLNLILLPGFCVVGATMLTLSFARAKGGARIFWILLVGGFLCCSSTGGLSLLALFGANSVVLGAMHRRMLEKMQNGGDDSSL